jgi:APA family basic amino acid/polyamine antiporter
MELELEGRRSGHLLRVLGAGFGIAVGVGTAIGSGILRTPGEVAAQLGSVPIVLVVWTLGGAYALLAASSAGELGAMVPSAGGFYAYAARAFGARIGFVIGSCFVVAQVVALAYLAVALGDFSGKLFPAIANFGQAIGVTGLLLLTALNWLGLRPGSRAQEITSVAKCVGLVSLIVASFMISPGAHALPALAVATAARHSLFAGLMVALPGVIITYDGWYGPLFFAEEDKNPTHNLPRSLIGTVLSCAAIYLLMNVAYLHVLGIGHLSGAQLPAADTAMLVFGRYGQRFILLISAIAVLSAMNALLMLVPRILFAMARDGLLPLRLAGVNKGGTPAAALLFSCFAGVLLILTGTYDSLIAIASRLSVVIYLSCFLALLRLRQKEPATPRPYRAWGYPWSTLLVTVVSASFLVGSISGDPLHSMLTLGLILASYAVAALITQKSGEASAAADATVIKEK